MDHPAPRADVLSCVSTDELMEQLRRRSLGCMIVCVRAEEEGDRWHYALKGSSMLLGAMSAALSIKTSDKVVENHTRGDEFSGGSKL